MKYNIHDVKFVQKGCQKQVACLLQLQRQCITSVRMRNPSYVRVADDPAPDGAPFRLSSSVATA